MDPRSGPCSDIRLGPYRSPAGRLHPTRSAKPFKGGATGQAPGASYREQLRSYLRFFEKHGGARKARRARTLLVRAFWLRSLTLRGRARSRARDLKDWLASDELETLLK